MNRSGAALSHSKCENCPIHHFSICEKVDPAVRDDLARISSFRNYSEGETIFVEGDEVAIVGNVVSGVLKLVKTLPDGRQHIVGLIYPAGLFGRLFESKATFSIEAATDVKLCCFDRRRFEALASSNPIFAQRLLLVTQDELDAARDLAMLLGSQSALERIAAFILITMQRNQRQGRARLPVQQRPLIRFPISRRDLAAYLGTTTETISRSLHLMSRRGILRLVNTQYFEVLQPRALAALSGREDISEAAHDGRQAAAFDAAARHEQLVSVAEKTLATKASG